MFKQKPLEISHQKLFQSPTNGSHTFPLGHIPLENSPYGHFPARFCQHRTLIPVLMGKMSWGKMSMGKMSYTPTNSVQQLKS